MSKVNMMAVPGTEASEMEELQATVMEIGMALATDQDHYLALQQTVEAQRIRVDLLQKGVKWADEQVNALTLRVQLNSVLVVILMVLVIVLLFKLKG